VSIASKYGDPCSFGTKAILTLPPEEPAPSDALAPPDAPVVVLPESFFVHPLAIMVIANTTPTAPTKRRGILIDFSFELD
jgi:hypothetical protein